MGRFESALREYIMPVLFLCAALFAAIAAAMLFRALLRRMKAERYFTPLACALLLFEIFNATAFAALFAYDVTAQNFFVAGLGYLFVLMLPASAWAAQPLLETPRPRLALKLVMLAASIVLGLVHAQSGLLQAWQLPESGFIFVLTSGGKFFFAIALVAAVLLLSKFAPLMLALDWRVGKRSRFLSSATFMLLLTLLAACSLSLIYGRLDYALWFLCQIQIGALSLVLAAALKNAPQPEFVASPSTLQLARVLSSSVLIYAGAYCIALGVLVKLALLLGGSWHLFVSFTAALGAVVLALVLLTGSSWQQRWARFVDRHWRAQSYDFRAELHQLTEQLAGATTEAELAEAINASLQEIFAGTFCRLWLRNEHDSAFIAAQPHEHGQIEKLVLSHKQKAWLARVGESFLPEQLFVEEEETTAHARILQSCALMSALQVGSNVIGVLGLGHKRNGQAYRTEDRQLLDVLANAASLALHQAHLQELVLAHEQTEAIARIAAFIAHDLRHAVSALGLLAHNAQAHLDKPEFRADFLASLSRVSLEMHALVQRLSAVKTSGESTQFEACDAARLIAEVVADMQFAPPIVVEMKLEALPQVWWDGEQIRIVLRNLLANAREAMMPQGGVLRIHARSDDARVRIIVRDEGLGMSPEFMRHRLFRPNQTTKTKGLGIGLYQSREIVRAHGGEILVESEEGRGTRFEVVLPCRLERISQFSTVVGYSMYRHNEIEKGNQQ